MKPGLFVLPFLAFVIAGIGIAVGAAYPESGIISAIGWALSAAVLTFWVVLDWDGFRRVFTQKRARFGLSTGLVIVLGMLVIAGIASLSSRPRFNQSLDLTRDSLNTLSDQSVKVIETLQQSDEPVRIDAFFLDEPVKTKFVDLIRLYQQEGANFQIEYIDPNLDPLAAKTAKLASNNTVIFHFGDNETRITVFTEEKVTNALVNISRQQTKTVYFTVGHGEGKLENEEADGYALIAGILDTFKYSLKPLNLLEETSVPTDAAAVVIATPRYDFKEEEIERLDTYLARGGSLFAVVGALVPVDRLNQLLETYGVVFNNDILLVNEAKVQVRTPDIALVTDFDEFHPITRDFGKQGGVSLTMRLARSVRVVEDNERKMKAEIVGHTAPVMASIDGIKSIDDARGKSYDPEMMQSFPILAVAHGKPVAKATAQKEQADGTQAADAEPAAPEALPTQGGQTRIVAVGATAFGDNVSVSEDLANRDMYTNIINYLSQDEDYISIAPKDPAKSELNVDSGLAMLALLLLFVYPFAFLGGGIVYWMSRRNA